MSNGGEEALTGGRGVLAVEEVAVAARRHPPRRVVEVHVAAGAERGVVGAVAVHVGREIGGEGQLVVFVLERANVGSWSGRRPVSGVEVARLLGGEQPSSRAGPAAAHFVERRHKRGVAEHVEAGTGEVGDGEQ